MDMTAVIEKMTALLLLVALGYLCSRCHLLDGPLAERISRLVVNVSIPAIVLHAAIEGGSDLSAGKLLSVLLVGLVMLGALGLMGYLAPLLWRPRREDLGTYRFVTGMPNMAFIGYPVVTAMFGSQALVYAAVLNLPFNLGVFVLGPLFMSGGGNRFSWRKLLNPGVFSALGAAVLVMTSPPVPALIEDVVGMAGDTATPLAMMVIGSQLADMPLREVVGDWRVYMSCLFRLAVLPAALWLLLRTFVTDPLILGSAVVMSATPAATSATVAAVEFGGNEKLASRVVLVSTVLSAASIPLMMGLLFG